MKCLQEKFFDEESFEDKAWRNLMNTTKRVKEIKKKTVYLVSKDSYALR